MRCSQNPENTEPGALLFCVKDTGIGIPQEKLGSIFENFTQADSSTTRKYGGTGLGLAISKRIVELMGGRIWVESTIGVGSRFLFTAKFAASARPGTATVPPAGDVLISSPVPAAGEMPAMHILLADDSEDNRFLIAEYLKRSSCILDIAENGEIALGMMKNRHYDLVLMDAHMPVMDGLDATRAMRALGARPERFPAAYTGAHRGCLQGVGGPECGGRLHRTSDQADRQGHADGCNSPVCGGL